MSDSLQLHELQPARLLCLCDSPGKNTEWVCLPSSSRYSPSRDGTPVCYVSCIDRWVLYHQHCLGSSEEFIVRVDYWQYLVDVLFKEFQKLDRILQDRQFSRRHDSPRKNIGVGSHSLLQGKKIWDLPEPGKKSGSPALQEDSLLSKPSAKSRLQWQKCKKGNGYECKSSLNGSWKLFSCHGGESLLHNRKKTPKNLG